MSAARQESKESKDVSREKDSKSIKEIKLAEPPVDRKLETPDLNNLPNSIVIIHGFLEPYKVLRANNGVVAVYKSEICDQFIKEIKAATSLEDWESILDKMDKHIMAEHAKIKKTWTKVRNIGKKASALVGSIFGYGNSTETSEEQAQFSLEHAFLTMLLGARTYACMQLQQKNSQWNKIIKDEFKSAAELQAKIEDAKANTTSDIVLLEPTWERDLANLLQTLAKKYHTPSIIKAQYWLKEYLPETGVLSIAKTNPYLPELYQPDFYERVFPLIQPAFTGRFDGKTFKEFEQYLTNTYKRENSPHTTTQIHSKLGSSPGDSKQDVQAPPPSAKPLRKLEDEDIKILDQLPEQVIKKHDKALSSVKSKLKEFQKAEKATSIYSARVLERLETDDWTLLQTILTDARKYPKDATPEPIQIASSIMQNR